MNTNTLRAPENHTFDYADGYVAKAIETSPNTYAVTMYAPNGDESPVFTTVVEAEQWMLRHFHSEVTGHHMLCGCFSS